jgi:hypothetical protein
MGCYETFCVICGFAIPLSEVGVTIEQESCVDYIVKQECSFKFDVCSECWTKIKENLDGGLEAALEKNESIERFDKLAKERSE